MKMTMWTLGAAVAALLATVGPASAQAVDPDLTYGPYGPGRGQNAWFNEWDRLSRHAYDYYYRNSNNNVYRNSRHFSPTQNVFRSSRHYQQKLRAATDGYPVRSFAQITETIDGSRPFVRTWSWAYHNPYPFRHYGFPPPWTEGGYGPSAAYSINQNMVRVANIRWERPTATDDPIVQKYTLPSGKKTTIVVSMPPEPDIDDAWHLLAAGADKTAATYFAQFMNGDRGVEARLGYGLALAESGDTDAAAQELDAAILADGAITSDPQAWAPLHPVLEEMLTTLGGDGDATATIRGVLRDMLGQTDVATAD